MRAFVILCFAILGVKGFAQDPNLFSNPWYFEVMNIDGEIYHPPGTNNEAVVIPLELTINSFTNTFCHQLQGNNLTFPDPLETLIVESFTITGDPCLFGENEQMETLYFDSFWKTHIPNQSFSYGFGYIDPGDKVYLEITNSDGDWAWFTNHKPLGLNEINKIQTIIYPNPVSETLHIQSQEDPEEVAIYGVMGQLLMTVYKDFENIPVSNLPTGLYFVEVRTSQGAVVKRVVKE